MDMDEDPLQLRILEAAQRYLDALSGNEYARFTAALRALCTHNIGAVHTKKLRGPIRELIIGDHRITYFKMGRTLYFVRGFRKSTQKTPLVEIEYAEKMHALLH